MKQRTCRGKQALSLFLLKLNEFKPFGLSFSLINSEEMQCARWLLQKNSENSPVPPQKKTIKDRFPYPVSPTLLRPKASTKFRSFNKWKGNITS